MSCFEIPVQTVGSSIRTPVRVRVALLMVKLFSPAQWLLSCISGRSTSRRCSEVPLPAEREFQVAGPKSLQRNPEYAYIPRAKRTSSNLVLIPSGSIKTTNILLSPVPRKTES